MLLKRMQPYWRNILKNKKFLQGYYGQKIAMISSYCFLQGCGQKIRKKKRKKETVDLK